MKTLIAVPCFDMVNTDFMESMVKLRKTQDCSFTVVRNTLIYDARNIIAGNAIAAGFDRVMWLDSDMRFEPDTLERLSADMDTGIDIVSGLYFTRRPPKIKPVMFKELVYDRTGEDVKASALFYYDYPEGLTECAGVGFGCCLTSVDLLKRVTEKFGSPFNPLPMMGEDMAFCLRVINLGEKIYCDTSVKCGHVGSMAFDESYYRTQGENMG